MQWLPKAEPYEKKVNAHAAEGGGGAQAFKKKGWICNTRNSYSRQNQSNKKLIPDTKAKQQNNIPVGIYVKLTKNEQRSYPAGVYLETNHKITGRMTHMYVRDTDGNVNKVYRLCVTHVLTRERTPPRKKPTTQNIYTPTTNRLKQPHRANADRPPLPLPLYFHPPAWHDRTPRCST